MRKTTMTLAAIFLVMANANAAEVLSGDPAFSHFAIVLYVDDVRKSAAWYQDVLGFKLVRYVVGNAQRVTSLPPAGPEPYAADLLVGNQPIGLQRSSGEARLP